MPAQSAAFAPLSKEQLAHFEKRLLEERKRALREMGRFAETFGLSVTDASGELTNYPFHLADQGTETMEQEKNFLLASQEGRLIWHIDEALRRLYRTPETFGQCHSCGRLIAYERLDALPHARFCVECKKREENGEGSPIAER
jgi:RNA polymerase-binding transcription factor DksA